MARKGENKTFSFKMGVCILFHTWICLLICTLTSENQGLEKLRSVSNLRKNFRACTPGFFFFSLSPGFFQVYGINLAFFLGGELKKKSRFAGPEIFLRFDADLDISRPWFSEIKVKIKRPIVGLPFGWSGAFLKCKWFLKAFSCNSFGSLMAFDLCCRE